MLSAVIATYKRPYDCISTIQSLKKVSSINEIIVVGDNCPDFKIILNYFKGEGNMIFENQKSNNGPGMTKDIGVKKCSNNYILIVDDDIEIVKFPTLSEIEYILSSYSLIQGVILDENMNKRKNEQPYWLGPIFDRNGVMRIGHFIGAIHLVKKDHYLLVGGYKKNNHYGFEELQLSLSLQRNGFKLGLYNKIIIKHFKSPLGRKKHVEVKMNMLKNRVNIANEFFPFPFNYIQSIAWNIILFKTIKYLPKRKYSKNKLRIIDFIKYPRILIRLLW